MADKEKKVAETEVKSRKPEKNFKGVKLEMKKVVWPTKKEMVSYTAVVIATCAVFALGFWLIDTGVLAALKSVLNITLN